MIRIAIAVAATAVASVLAAAPATATTGTSCHTIHGPFPTVEMCLNIPDPGVQ